MISSTTCSIGAVASIIIPFFGMSSFVWCNRAMSSRSVFFPPHSFSGRSSSRRFNVSMSTSRTNTPSNRSMNFEKFLEPPQKNVTASSWLATKAFTLSTCQMWCSCCGAIRRCTSFRIALISQFTVTMNGMVAAPLQFVADCSFAGAGNAFNQIISNAHR